MNSIDHTELPTFGAETSSYGVLRKPFSSPLPSLDHDVADDEYDARLLDFAANCLSHVDDRSALRDSDDHVIALLYQLERLDLGLASKSDECNRVRNAHQVTVLELEAAQGKIEDLDALLTTETARLNREALMHTATINRLVAQTAESYQLGRKVDTLANENRMLRAALDKFSGRGRPGTTTMTNGGER